MLNIYAVTLVFASAPSPIDALLFEGESLQRSFLSVQTLLDYDSSNTCPIKANIANFCEWNFEWMSFNFMMMSVWSPPRVVVDEMAILSLEERCMCTFFVMEVLAVWDTCMSEVVLLLFFFFLFFWR